MIIDARSLPPDEVLETHVCIVGAGPAGITLAREFANQDFQVCLLESGGLDSDSETQSLADGIVIGDPYPEISQTRLRQFGGTSHFWEGQNGYKEYGFRCLPLDEIDFEQRDWLPYSGWPFTKAHLEPFYERAQTVCKIGPYAYNAEDWEDRRAVRLPFKGDRVTTSISQYAPRAPFTHEYRDELKRAPNVTTVLYANVINIETDEANQTVTRLQIACLQNREFWITAKVVILATGGLENARLLLASNQRQLAGLGNQNDVVVENQPYAAHPAKIDAERRLMRLRKKGSVEVVIFRPGIVFGPRSRWVIDLANQLSQGTAYFINKGQGICNSVYIDNLIHAMRLSLTAPNADGEAFFVGDRELVTWFDFYRPFAEAFGIDPNQIPQLTAPEFTQSWKQQTIDSIRNSELVQRLLSTIPNDFKQTAKTLIPKQSHFSQEQSSAAIAKPQPVVAQMMAELQQSKYKLPLTKAEKLLGYEPIVSFNEGCNRSIKWLADSQQFNLLDPVI